MGENGRALVHALVAMAALGFADNLVPLISESHGLAQFHFLRGVGALVLIAVLMAALGKRWRTIRPGWVLLRSVIASLAMVIYFGCLPLMPISQVAAGLFTAPIFVLLAEALVMRRRVTPTRAMAVALGFVGILLVTGPNGPLGPVSVLPVVAGFCYGMGNFITRHRCLEEEALVLLAGFFGAMVVWGGLGLLVLGRLDLAEASFATRGWVAPDRSLLLVVGAQILCAGGALGLMARAYQTAEASLVAVYENVFLVFASLFAFLFWGQAPGAVALAGMGLIASGGALAAWSRPRVVPLPRS